MSNFKLKKIFGGVMVLGVIILPSTSVFADDNGWGPQNRKTFTWENPATYATFNSITDNPNLGDERNFVRVKEVGTDDKYADDVEVSVGKEYEIYVLYHNDASANLNKSGKGIADDVKLKMAFPEHLQKGESAVMKGTITSSNTKPKKVWDSAYLKATEEVYLRYVANSAVIHNGGSSNGSILDQDSLFGKGVLLAYWNSEWGMIPGCDEYSGYVTFRVKADQPDSKVTKTAKVDGGDNDFATEINANPGAVVDFQVTYKNTGTTVQKTVVVKDELPEGLDYVSNSTKLTLASTGETKTVPDDLFGDGLNIGDFRAGGSATITYQVVVRDDSEIFSCGDTEVYNSARVITTTGTFENQAKVTITRNCNGDGGGGDGDKTGGDKNDGDTETPSELPNTGPAEIIVASIVLLLIGGGFGYWISSLRQLYKTMK